MFIPIIAVAFLGYKAVRSFQKIKKSNLELKIAKDECFDQIESGILKIRANAVERVRKIEADIDQPVDMSEKEKAEKMAIWKDLIRKADANLAVVKSKRK